MAWTDEKREFEKMRIKLEKFPDYGKLGYSDKAAIDGQINKMLDAAEKREEQIEKMRDENRRKFQDSGNSFIFKGV